MTPAYIALGSNLQNPGQQLSDALTALDAIALTQLDEASGFYRSAAIGPGSQPDYLNAVARLLTTLEPLALLHALQAIEQQQGRVRDEHWGPRTLDLDLLLFADVQLQTPELTIPHPRMHERNFVLYPLLEISDTTLPVPGGNNLGRLVEQCPLNDLVKVSAGAGNH